MNSSCSNSSNNSNSNNNYYDDDNYYRYCQLCSRLSKTDGSSRCQETSETGSDVF